MDSKSKELRFKVTFRTTLFALLLGVLLTSLISLGISGYIYARFAVSNLGDQVLDQTAARIDQHIQHALDTAEDEAETIAGLFKNSWLDPEDHESVTEYFLEALKARPFLSYLSFGSPTGKYYHGFRDRSGKLTTLWLVPKESGNNRLLEFLIAENDEREVIRDIPKSIRIVPYERPYYLTTRDAGKAIWTESYVFQGSGELLDVPGVSRAIPIYSKAQEFQGVLTADFDLHALSRFLREVDLGSGGLCFLVEITSEDSARIIAHPDAADPDRNRRIDLTKAAPDGNGRITLAADQIADPRVASILPVIEKGLNTGDRSSRKFNLLVKNQNHLGEIHHLGRKGGPNWIICMMLPESELFGDVQRMARLMALIGLGGVLITAVLSLLLSKSISATLRSLAIETLEVGQFRLKNKEPVLTRIVEIETLANALEEMKTGLRSFQKYVPSDLVRQLLETGKEAELGGERKELTVYFSDIVGFTSISEQLSSKQLSELLSDYLEEMSGEVLRSGGTVDKYIGDSIMAFWGAPQPCHEHAKQACLTALANRARLKELRDAWEGIGLPPLHARIGLHTGFVMVGNFGSPDRLDYTAIGDAVNLASRLEGLNRIYGTEILISESTLQPVRDQFVTRALDKVAVKGREQGIMIHELVAQREHIKGSETEWIKNYETGLKHYFARHWPAAIDSFQAALEVNQMDKASQVMVERCSKFPSHQPPKDWDGVYFAPK